jgi:hypothetical protein
MLMPPRDAPPADVLRWFRRFQLVFAVPLGVLVTLILLAEGMDVWWLGVVVVVTGLLGALSMGSSIRRHEGEPAPDPATAPARRRRAIRLTMLLFAPFILAGGIVLYVAGGFGAMAVYLVVMAISLPLGLRLGLPRS